MSAKNTKHIRNGLYLIYSPVFLENKKHVSFRLYILNNLDQTYDINCTHFIKNNALNTTKAMIKPLDFCELGVISLEDCNYTQKIDIQAKNNKKDNFKANKKIAPKKFFTPFQNIPIINKHGIIVELYTIKKKKEEKNSSASVEQIMSLRDSLMGRNKKEERKVLRATSDIVDLHWEKLKANNPGLKKNEIFDIQLQTFEKELDTALANGKQEIIFIHGLGSGQLKNAIFAMLDNHPLIRDYKNSFDPRFGYGATKVLLHI